MNTRNPNANAVGIAEAPARLMGVTPLYERRNYESRQLLLARLRGEFREMPCLSLTFEQSMRLFGLEEDVCSRLLKTMVDEGTIWLRSDGRYTARLAS